MNGRSASTLVATLALVGTVFAGCIQPDWLSAASSRSEISALEDKDLADNAAKAWNPNATLLSVFTIELGTNESQNDIPLDPHVGNGKAPVWFYVYCAMDRSTATAPHTMAAFRVTADGRVRQENDTMMGAAGPQMKMKDISSWKVDSPKALDAAKTNQTFADTLRTPNASLAEGVAWIDGKAAWYFAAGGERGATIAIVDAATGKLLDVRALKFDLSSIPDYARPAMMPMAPLHVEGKGTLSPDARTKEFPFAWQGGPTVAQLDITSNGRTPLDGLAWRLMGPSGKEVKPEGSKTRAPGTPRSQNGGAQYAFSEAGEYKLVLEYRGPASMLPVGGAPVGSTDFKFVLSNEMHGMPHEP